MKYGTENHPIFWHILRIKHFYHHKWYSEVRLEMKKEEIGKRHDVEKKKYDDSLGRKAPSQHKLLYDFF